MFQMMSEKIEFGVRYTKKGGCSIWMSTEYDSPGPSLHTHTKITSVLRQGRDFYHLLSISSRRLESCHLLAPSLANYKHTFPYL